ncbi:MAG: hypothetical protein K0U68_05255 [Gammaproteobacteria bacterium]|nr:hypothetical protein [Gammaproteobacteria bacterium]
MKRYARNIKPKIFAFIIFSLVVMLSACSSDSDDTDQATDQSGNKTLQSKSKSSELDYAFDHPHDESVTDMEKHKFQHIFADQCVEREIRSNPAAGSNRKSLQKTCMCIADYVMKDLTAVEAEKFLDEKKHPTSLKIRFNNATYFCSK